MSQPFDILEQKPLTEAELDEICEHCGKPLRDHRMPAYRCRGALERVFEPSGRRAPAPPDLRFERALFKARMRGFQPLWHEVTNLIGERTGEQALMNAAEMWELAREGDDDGDG